MYVDLHCHSVVSDDARATVEQYGKWIQSLRRKGFKVDGIVLTEHRTFDHDGDYRAIEDKYGFLVLKATELDTDAGHFLVYGVNEELLRKFDFKNVRMNAVDLVKTADASGALAIPAHPGRERVGFVDLAGERDFSTVGIVETLNGGSREWENHRAQGLAQEKGYHAVGGSDAHFVNAIGRFMTKFDEPVRDIDGLITALRSGKYQPVQLDHTLEPSVTNA